jgi:TorA maturation chaperone TorD
VQLSFISYLLEREEGHPSTRLDGFIKHHFINWVPTFIETAQTTVSGSYCLGLLGHLQWFVEALQDRTG